MHPTESEISSLTILTSVRDKLKLLSCRSHFFRYDTSQMLILSFKGLPKSP